MIMGKREASKRRRQNSEADRRGGRRDEQHARRHEERNAKRKRRYDATPNDPRSGTGSEPIKQAERN